MASLLAEATEASLQIQDTTTTATPSNTDLAPPNIKQSSTNTNDSSDNSNNDSENDSDNNSDNDSSSNNNSSSDEGYSGYSSSDNEAGEDRTSLLEKNSTQVQRLYGASSCYILPLDTAKALYDEYSLVYLSFPIDTVMAGKKNLAGAWGFDPTLPIQVRFRAHHFDFDTADLAQGINHLDFDIYQGEEPPVFTKTASTPLTPEQEELALWREQAANDSGHKGEQKNEGGGGVRFRLREQLKRIGEEFLICNWQGQGKRHDPLLTLTVTTADEKAAALPMLRQSSSIDCPHCTYINLASSATCDMCTLPLRDDVQAAPKETKTPSKTNATPTTSTTDNPQRTRKDLLLPFLDRTVVDSGSECLLVRLYTYFLVRIPQLHRFCVICDHPHVNFLSGSTASAGGTMLRPSVCRRDLCSWSFTELNVGKKCTTNCFTANRKHGVLSGPCTTF